MMRMTANNANVPTERNELATKTGERGVASLVMVLVLGGLVVELALSAILLVTLLNDENFGIQLSARALAAAQSGISEGLLRIVRDKNFTVETPLPADFDVGSAVIKTLRICKDTVGNSADGPCGGAGATSAIGRYEILSVGLAFTRKRQLVAVAAVDDVTGLVTVVSLDEQQP